MWQDKVNGLYELLGGFFLYLHFRQLVKDKSVKGVNVGAFAFFASWGIWNLFYYPCINQWWSFVGGFHIVFWSILWVIMAVVYSRRNK